MIAFLYAKEHRIFDGVHLSAAGGTFRLPILASVVVLALGGVGRLTRSLHQQQADVANAMGWSWPFNRPH